MLSHERRHLSFLLIVHISFHIRHVNIRRWVVTVRFPDFADFACMRQRWDPAGLCLGIGSVRLVESLAFWKVWRTDHDFRVYAVIG